MTKLHENIYRTVNISLVNGMKMICDKFGINIYEVIEAAKPNRLGSTLFIQDLELVDIVFLLIHFI